MTPNHQSLTNSTGWSQKSFRSYVFGFVMCLAITLLAFGLVQYSPISKTTIYVLITVLALVQMIIQAICFLGLKSGTDGRWNVLPFLFTILIIFFLAGGTLWIMYNLTVLMMDPYMY